MANAVILRKLLWAAFLLILVALGSATLLITRYTAGHEVQHAERAMQGQIRILAPALAVVPPGSLIDWARRSGEQSGARVTVIDRQGRVLADSQHDSSSMDNHAGRPEVREAISGRTGTAVRHSATLDVDLCYVASPVLLAGQTQAILRLAVPLRQVQITASEIRVLIFQASLIALVAALLLGYFLSRLLSARILRIQAYARELVNAEYSAKLATEPDDELGSVARSLRDMADQFRQMLRRLSDEASLRNAILSSMVEGVVAVDHDLRVTFCNASFLRAVNDGEPLSSNLPLRQAVKESPLGDLLERVIADKEPRRMRLTLATAESHVFEVQAAPIDEESASGAIAILHEITKVEQLERVRKDFVANISHDLRTPLASIQGYAETLLDTGSEDQANNRRFLEIIRANAVRLGDLAADLLTLSELETERSSPPEEAIPVREAAAYILARVEEEAAVREVCVTLDDGPDAEILGPPLRFEHALINLVRNAIKFNRPGGEVHIETAIEGREVLLIVRDTGIGIPAADLPRIFERSYCVDKARSREFGGTGLGLAIVKHIVSAMRGTIAVESELGKGTTFTIRFPRADV
jgi:two-component system phosphate regulon sensor histidine kinase PhoR